MTTQTVSRDLRSTHLLFGDEFPREDSPRENSPREDGPEFMWGNCWLYVQTGNEPPEYAFNFQDELALYVGLLGFHPLLFVGPGTHQTRRDYQERADLLKSQLAVAQKRACVRLPFPRPLGVDFDVQRQRIDYGSLIDSASNEADRRLAGELLSRVTSIRYNQLTAMHADSLQHFARSPTGRSCDRERVDETCKLAELLMRLHDKAEFLQLVRGATRDLPPHVETEFLRLSEFPDTWPSLLARLGWTSDKQRLIVKSTQDDCGDVMTYLDESGYAAQLEGLHQQIRVKSSNPNRPDTENGFLVQGVIQSPKETEALRGIPDCFGINYYLRPDGEAEFICISKQLYADPEHKVHLGSHWSAETEQNVLAELQPARLQNLCRLLSDIGYRGPVGFDGMRDPRGGAVLIFDCNPRMTGVFPVLAVRNLLQKQGVEIQKIANAGYHGSVRHDSIDGLCDWLDQRRMLFTKDQPTGVLPLPNLAGCKTGLYDIFFVNLDIELVHSVTDELRTAGYLAIEGIYE